jgi:HEAT repeat protein
VEKRQIPFTSNELVEMLKSNDPEERAAGARRIWTDWELLDQKDLLIAQGPLLLKFLSESSSKTREIWHYMIALGTINFTEALPIIKDQLINSPSENIRGFAADALSRYNVENIDDETKELLWKLAETDDSLVVRVNSIRAIGNGFIKTKNTEISEKLLVLLKKQTHNAIKSTIIGLIGDIGSLVVVPELVHIMITRRTEANKKIASIALDQIAKLNGYKNRAELIKIIEAPKYDLEE